MVEDCGVTLGGGIFLLVNGGNSLIIIKDSSLSTIELSFQAGKYVYWYLIMLNK